MKKKKSPREVIENAEKPHMESSYVKFPGEEVKDVSGRRGRFDTESSRNRMIKESKGKQDYTSIHTHPTNIPYFSLPNLLDNLFGGKIARLFRKKQQSDSKSFSFADVYPSSGDIKTFLIDKKDTGLVEKTSVIVGRDYKSGETGKSFIMKKTSRTPVIKGFRSLNEDSLFRDYGKQIGPYRRDTDKGLEILGVIADKYQFQFRFLNEEGRTDLKYNPNPTNLEGRMAASVLVFLSSLVLMSFKITGFSIYNISANSLSIIGGGLFFISLILMLLFFKKGK